MTIKKLTVLLLLISLFITTVGCKSSHPIVEQDDYECLYLFKENGKWGYMSKEGETIIYPQFNDYLYYCFPKENQRVNLLPTYFNGKLGLIDRTGKFVIDAEYDDLQIIFDGGFIFYEKDETYGIMDFNGRMLMEFDLDYMYGFSQDEKISLVILNDEYTYVNHYGALITNLKFSDAGWFAEGLAPVQMNDSEKWGYIDTKGELVIKPQFDYAEEFSEGLAAVIIDDKYGFINTKGEVVIKPQFDFVGKFSEGLVSVIFDYSEKWGFIDKTGKLVINPQFDHDHSGSSITRYTFFEGLASVQVDGKWGFIDVLGNMVIEPRYNFVTRFIDGLAMVLDDDNLGWITTEGDYIKKFEN